jgi:hypothetical protein
VNTVTKARLFTILMVVVMLAMLVAKLKGLGMNDGGYWA